MKILAHIAIVSFFLVGCLPAASNPTREPSHTDTLMPSATVMPTDTPTSTAIPNTPTSPSIFAPLVTYAPGTNIQVKCMEGNHDAQKSNLGTGVVILSSSKVRADGSQDQGFYFLNMQTGVMTSPLGIDTISQGESVSPDGTLLLALANGLGYSIMTADGKTVKKLGLLTGSDPTWMDSQHLMINLATLDPDENKALKPSTMLMLNLFTGEKRVLPPDFPGISTYYPLPYWDAPWGNSLVVYNPSLTRAIYLADPGVIDYVLWDMKNKKALLRWENFPPSEYGHPRWSPDGSRFLMEVSNYSNQSAELLNGLYIVDKDGNISLPPLIDDASAKIPYIDYFWSPSGRYVALPIIGSKGADGSSKVRWLVLDVETRAITDYCIETPQYLISAIPLLFWSPDETQILINDRYSSDHSRVMLIDLAKGTAFSIVEDMIATGWMKSP